MSQRFTVSLHRVASHGSAGQPRGDHLDWFFAVSHDAKSPLVTWSTPTCWYLNSVAPALRLPAHRARYLDYEGNIAGDRGNVQRLVTGTYRLLADDGTQFTFAVESVAIANVSAASIVDRAARRLAAILSEQLDASLGEEICFRS